MGQPAAAELKNQRGEDSIFQSCFGGQFDRVKTFIINNPKDLNAVDETGRTLLHWAVSGKHTELVNLLLDAKIKTNVRDDHGTNELMVACTVGSLPLAKLLLSAGIPSIPNNNKRTNLHYCASKGYMDIMDLLIEIGGDVNAQDELGQTPLFRCSARGHIASCKKLLDNGAKVNHIDGQNETCLHLAMEEGHVSGTN